MTGRELREIAAKLYNLDFDTLVEAGVLDPVENGTSSQGFGLLAVDPLRFILRLPDDRREALARLVSP